VDITYDKLAPSLKKSLAPCYFVHGEETLLIEESADLIRRAAKQHGCTERDIIDIAKPEDWIALSQSAGALSLFADKKLIEVRLPSGKPGAEGSKALQAFLDSDSDDILLIIAGKVDAASRKSKWYTALGKKGVTLTAWPIKPNELPKWIDQRMRSLDMRCDPEGVRLIADRVQGNLLAAKQEVEKLRLLIHGDHVTAQDVIDAVLDNARFTPFELVDSALAGQGKQALRIARGLHSEGVAVPIILWAITRDLLVLCELLEAKERGVPPQRAMQEAGVWSSRQGLFQSAAQRHTRQSAQLMTELSYQIDGMSKGFISGDPWLQIDAMVSLLAGSAHDSNKWRR
jgi:DNA polymerase-3 subunit delta